MKVVKIGFIGAGFMSQIAHLPSFYDDKRVNIVALSELNKRLLQKVSKKYQIKKIYKSYKDMIAIEKLDGLVLVANRSNVERIAKDVLTKGIALFSEKPMATSYLFAKKLVNISKKNKTKYLVGHMKRHDNGIKELQKILNKNKLGKLLSVYYQNFIGDSFYNPFDYFRHDKNYRKKNTLNKNLKNKKLIFLRYLNSNGHCINLIRFLFGDIKVISKNLSNSGEGIVFFKNNKNVNIIFNNQFSKATRWIENMKINFEKGSINVKVPAPLLKNVPAKIQVEEYSNGYVYSPGIKWGWSFRNQSKDFIDYIISNKISKYSCLAKDSTLDIKIIESLFYK